MSPIIQKRLKKAGAELCQALTQFSLAGTRTDLIQAQINYSGGCGCGKKVILMLTRTELGNNVI